MLNPFINPGLEIALKELFRDNVSTEQVHPAVKGSKVGIENSVQVLHLLKN